jgi:hypothetical protein
MKPHRRAPQEICRLGVEARQIPERGLGIREDALATAVRCANALQQLIARRLIEERLIGVQIDRRVGVPELVGVRVRRVIGRQVDIPL